MLSDPEHQQDEDIKAMEEQIVKLGQATTDDFYVIPESKKHEPFEIEFYIRRALVRAFHLAQQDAQRDKNVPTSTSGCTCVVCFLDEVQQKIYVAHVGDSLAVTASIVVDE